MSEKSQKHVKKRLRWGRVFFLGLLCLVLLGGMALGAKLLYNRFFAPRNPVVAATEEIGNDETLNRRINVLLLGIDEGEQASTVEKTEKEEEEPKRSDAMLVVSFDPDNNEVALISLPRDTRVDIPHRRYPDKIAHAYAYGGVPLAKQTVANLLKIPIHYYVLANWQGFIDVVDILGGVDMYVEDNMNYEDPYANLKIHLKKGYQHLNGKQAGEYVRFRHDELGDIGRVQRQQKLLKALAGELFNVGNMTKVPALVETVDKYIDTDMDTLTMISAANSFKLFGSDRVASEMLYGDFETIDAISYWVTTPNKIQLTLDSLKIPHGTIEGADPEFVARELAREKRKKAAEKATTAESSKATDKATVAKDATENTETIDSKKN